MNLVSRTIHRWTVIPALRILIGVVFIWAGQAKSREPAALAESIASFRVLPPALDNLVALALPPFEMLLGGLLVVGVASADGEFLRAVDERDFSLGAGFGVEPGIAVECACFGTEPGFSAHAWPVWLLVVRDLLLVIGTGTIYFNARRVDASAAFVR